jgi:hypothetical protein
VTSAGLAQAQRWLQRAILADQPASEPAAARVLAPAARLSAGECLGVYRRGYRLRLLETMAALHPGLRAWLGPDLFADFVLEYLDACPSRSYTLVELDRGFAAHLAERRPDRDRPPARREAWIDLLIDLARYERAFAEVYDGPGTEHLPEHLPPRRPGSADTVRLAPCLRVLTACAPVHRYVAAVRAGQPPPPLTADPVRLALSRRDYVVTATELSPAACRFLSALLAGDPVRAAADRAALAADAAARLLDLWAGAGWLLPAPSVPSDPSASCAPSCAPSKESA